MAVKIKPDLAGTKTRNMRSLSEPWVKSGARPRLPYVTVRTSQAGSTRQAWKLGLVPDDSLNHNLQATQATMPLVDYPDSETERDDSSDDIGAQPVQIPTKAAIKRKRSASAQDDLPPLPAAFHDLYSTNARVSTGDNPKLHGGRKRTVPHIEGNWPSHVYLECKDVSLVPLVHDRQPAG